MRPRLHAAIANCARRRRLWHANQSRDVRKSAGPPARQLRAAATVPFARVELEIAHASRVSGERVSRSRTFPLRPTRLCDSRSKESLFWRCAETRHARRMRYPGVNRTIQLFDGDDA